VLIWLVVAALIGLVVFGIGRPVNNPLGGVSLASARDVDLPCPWCFAQTSEDDASCPSCGQRFG